MNDPDNFDGRVMRNREIPAEELRVGWGEKSVTLRGALVIIVVLFAVQGIAVGYFSDVSAREHRGLTREFRQQTCVLSLTVEERIRLRAQLAGKRGAEIGHAMSAWCPWIGSED